MCGIAGFYGFRNDKLIKKISKELSHRGPDGEGFYTDEEATLLNRRLAIIDIAGGDQPIYNEDKTIVVTYNGEIYNYQELRLQLEKAGHLFKTKSDTEVIVHSYEQWGEKCFDRFNGMFAVALYDIKKKRLILARDHFGIKPLYYAFPNARFPTYEVEDRFIFCSEIKPILNSGLVKKKPNDKIIYRYLKYRVHDDEKETFFKGIYKLMPGEMMIIQNSEFRIQNFTRLKEELIFGVTASPDSIGAKQSPSEISEFRKKLIEAIRLRLISEVPVGTCLSGGLDSSTVVAIVNRLLKKKVKETASVGNIQKTFSAVFPGSSNNEEKYINELINSNNGLLVKSYKTYPKPEEFFKDMTDFIRTQEEPTISTGPYAQYKVMQLAHKKITVVLDGQGADEMLAGYLPYYFVYLRELWKTKSIFKFTGEFINSLDIIIPYTVNQLTGKLGLKETIRVDDLLNPKFALRNKNIRFQATGNNLKKRLIEDIFHNSLPSLLRYEDKNAMRFSIEGRVPFLDFNLLKYLFSLDSGAIIKDGWNKYVLREATKDLLPPSINRRRNKIGFTTPEYEWFMRMKNKIYAIFLSQAFAERKYFNQPEVLRAFQKFIEGKIDDTMLFWRLLNLELWLREFFYTKSIKRVNGLKKRIITVEGKTYKRYPIKTELFKKGDNLTEKITKHLLQFNIKLEQNKPWFIVVSEKIVAITQGRSYFIWDIKPSFIAKFLSNYVTRTPYGIGLGSPWTMQLAIDEVGFPKIILATIVSQIGKLIGIKGLFYNVAGATVRAIDGPTEYSLYPSNVSAKLGPKDPQKVARQIHDKIKNLKFKISNFLGVAIIDANDIGQNVLGNSTSLPDSQIERIFKDNPMGQADEQTPITVVQLKHEKKRAVKR